jgi:DNA (cytosine-5)-methyltransferase 1
MSAYYNEIDPYAAQWLRNLIAGGLIAAGDVDERSILDVKPDDLSRYTQCHFFAGIAGWSHALRLAMFPDDRPVWTGSCPCQPFSAAGKGKASGDERHLWPHWFELIRACRPPIIFGEQVEAAIGWGWLDLVYSDLEAEGYAVGATVLPACSVGAPHIRQRLWFVANAESARWGMGQPSNERAPEGEGNALTNSSHLPSLLADSISAGLCGGNRPQGTRLRDATDRHGSTGELADAGLMDNAAGQGLQERPSEAVSGEETRAVSQRPGEGWSDLAWLPCTDGKQRPTQSGIFPLAHGVSGRVAKLRAAGNAIVPQVAAEFIKATMP